jgi:hypothetical protein
MQAYQLSIRWRAAVLLVAGMLVVVAMAACGGDDVDAAPAENSAAAESTATETPAGNSDIETSVDQSVDAQAPTASFAPMVPAVEYEAGSDEAQILAVLELQVRSVNNRDYASFAKTCTPNAKSVQTIDQIKFVFEERFGGAPRSGNSVTILFTPEGYNVRNAEAKLLRAPFGQATIIVYNFDDRQGEALRTFEKVDGQWYSENVPCGRG